MRSVSSNVLHPSQCGQPSVFYRIFREKTTHLSSALRKFLQFARGKNEPPSKSKPARFLSSRTLPPGITASSKGPSFAYCKFCKDNFSVTHGGCNDVSVMSWAKAMKIVTRTCHKSDNGVVRCRACLEFVFKNYFD